MVFIFGVSQIAELPLLLSYHFLSNEATIDFLCHLQTPSVIPRMQMTYNYYTG